MHSTVSYYFCSVLVSQVSDSIKAANRVKWTNEQLPTDDELYIEFPLVEDA